MKLYSNDSNVSKILGYINPNGFLPSPVVTIISRKGKEFAIFPTLTCSRLENFNEEKDKFTNFTMEKPGATIKPGQYTYCFSEGIYFTNYPIQIILDILDAFSANPKYFQNEIYLDIISEYIQNEDIRKAILQSKFDIPTCLRLSKHLPILTIQIKNRTKKNKEVASKLLVSYIYKKQKKTVYKKNLALTTDIITAELKSKTLHRLMNAVVGALSGNPDRVKQVLSPSF